jgi:hypothetical protein
LGQGRLPRPLPLDEGPRRRERHLIPLYGFLRGDTIGLLILARAEDSVASLAEQLQRSAAVRVARREPVAVLFKERVLDPHLTVAGAGLAPLDRFDVVPAERG